MEWRFIDSGFADGATNMAVDDALLDSVRQGISPPCLRVYRWAPAAVSLGRNQAVTDLMCEQAQTLGIDIVRRPTGGRAVLHDGEFTYSFIGGSRHGFAESIDGAYAQLAVPLIETMTRLGIRHGHPGGREVRGESAAVSCFASFARADLAVSDQKLVGSAQARRGDSFLQHGSFLVKPDTEKWRVLFGEAALIGATSLWDLGGQAFPWEDWVSALQTSFAAAFGVRFRFDHLTADEQDRASAAHARWAVFTASPNPT
ncbi:MAG: lipoate--protein ligase family protein [Candidatus Sericytochromatia bacterium]|nr:lipoate--protein ligase family protein [Candidatus Sericytochromatia bacterium]